MWKIIALFYVLRSGEKDPGKITRCSIKKPRSRPGAGPLAADQSPEAEEGCGGPVDYTVRRLAEKFSVVNMRTASRAAEDVFVELENEVFNMSGLSEESSEDDTGK